MNIFLHLQQYFETKPSSVLQRTEASLVVSVHELEWVRNVSFYHRIS
uniref:Uncharacterized protein n=1 Tax=Anguilla anguilla TaxID=7936 RepID=A0A0E9U9Q9_ANGAN